MLASRIDRLAERFEPDEGQSKKLLQAGRGDLQRLRERCKELKKRFSEPSIVDDDHPRAVRAWAFGFIEEATKLQQALSGADLFFEESLFDKVLRRQLTAEQVAKYEDRDLKLRALINGTDRTSSPKRQ